MADINDTVQILFGPGGHVMLDIYGRHGRQAKSFDLTRMAADLASVGIRIPRNTCSPSEINGGISCDLGQNGRALWVNGGGDISDTELVWAIAAALEYGTDTDFDAILDSHYSRVTAQLTGYVDELLAAAGLSRRQRSAFTARTRRSLGGRSIRDVISATSLDDLTTLQSAFSIAVERSITEMGTEAASAWLDAHSFKTG